MDNDKLELIPTNLPQTGFTFLPAPSEFTMTFVQDGKNIATLTWDPEDRELKFNGQLNKSADLLFELFRMKFEEWEAQRGD